MTRHQTWLLDSAREALAYFDKREKGEPTIGVSDPVWIGRMLRESIEAVESEERLKGVCVGSQ